MLVIIVALLIGLTSQIIKPMDAFIKNYMGSYVQCLLEMGELPSIGSEDTAVEDEGCNARFQAGTWANGRPPNGSGSGGSSGSGSGSNKDGSGSGSGSDGSSGSGSGSNKDGSGSGSGSDGSSGSGGGGSSGGTYAGSQSRGGSRFMNRGRRPSSGVESGGGAQGKVVEIALEGGGSGGFFRGSSGGSYGPRPGKTRSVAISGLTEMERKKLEKKANGEGKASIVTGESLTPPVKKLAVKKPPVKTFEKEEEPFTIGNFIRILFIVAIILALVVFLGGQALQMSKSFEK
ncbi:hypothetical protein Bb109J_c3557 [Bdellovibrio bacteriovorus]|uniref:hypothetical protein n=1 Tax=Bdellovibrio bacteriovorus TaxID=959 RepID=UPI003086EBFE|nr:hypothetical protein Bb109J_c3557 [Bdellovibrio bacteriovorus]